MTQIPGSPRFLLPPVYFLAALLLMAFFHQVVPLVKVVFAPYRYAGIVIMALAIGLILWGVLHFRRAGTAIHPFESPSALVTGGPYRFTRNPMYLGLTGTLLGAGILMGSITPFVVIPAFMAVVTERFILGEEARLEAAFGAAYLEYKARVRRWL